jgi:hypothetical protein
LLSLAQLISFSYTGPIDFEIGILSLCYQQLVDNLDESEMIASVSRETDKTEISDEELVVDGIDYSIYSQSDLEDCLRNIDNKKYPDRVSVIKKALSRFK